MQRQDELRMLWIQFVDLSHSNCAAASAFVRVRERECERDRIISVACTSRGNTLVKFAECFFRNSLSIDLRDKCQD